MREPIPDELRRRVFRRDGKRCRYCGQTEGSFHLDHVYPVIKGGETTLENLVVSCKRCNLIKHSKVGVWPKPIGYFDTPVKPKNNREIVIRIPNINISDIDFRFVATVLSLVMLFLAIAPMTLFYFTSVRHLADVHTQGLFLSVGLILTCAGASTYELIGILEKIIDFSVRRITK